ADGLAEELLGALRVAVLPGEPAERLRALADSPLRARFGKEVERLREPALGLVPLVPQAVELALRESRVRARDDRAARLRELQRPLDQQLGLVVLGAHQLDRRELDRRPALEVLALGEARRLERTGLEVLGARQLALPAVCERADVERAEAAVEVVLLENRQR